MGRNVFFSFHYELDAWRVQQVKQMGRIEGQPLMRSNEWEEIKRGGDQAIARWINNNMSNKSCLVCLVGAQTANRRWVRYEIEKAWQRGMGVAGIRIHGLEDTNKRTSVPGSNPFAGIQFSTFNAAQIVTLYDPPGHASREIYRSIDSNIENLVESAISTRKRYPA